jgi:tol-pal system protein YbgF
MGPRARHQNGSQHRSQAGPQARSQAVVVAVFVVLAGCARTAEERHLDALRDEIDRIQADRDRANATMPESGAAEPLSGAVPPRLPVSSSPSPPDVVSLRPGAGRSDLAASIDGPLADYADTEDTTPRPSIRVLGAARANVRGAWRGEEQVETASDDTPPTAARSSALDPEAKRAYDAALSLVNARQYGMALEAFARFLVTWPDHPYADNAMYWRGECYFAQGDYARASEEFEGLVARFPAGNKAPDALLKLGLSEQKLGNPVKAKESFDRLARQYPQSPAARRIPPVTTPAATPRGPASEDHR